MLLKLLQLHGMLQRQANEAIKAERVLRRMCTPKARSGKIDVSKDVVDKFFTKAGKKELIELYLKCGGDKDRPASREAGSRGFSKCRNCLGVPLWRYTGVTFRTLSVGMWVCGCAVYLYQGTM